mgnify:CR=1 FL=1
MDKKYEPLFTPWKIGNVEIKNRIVLTSMGGTSIFGWMEPNHFDKEAANFLLERAKNNVGLILPGIAPVKNPFMGGWLYKNKGMYKKLKVFMDEYHKTGAKLFVQLTAGFGRSMAINALMDKASKNKAVGLVLKPIFNMNKINVSASATPNRWDPEVIQRPLTVEEIRQYIDAFAKTAKLCKEAGVDGVEIHAVHEGYLLDQFAMKYSNLRTDDYGGSLENRLRFPVEIVKSIKELCGKDYPVSLRYSVVSKTKGFQKGALPGEIFEEVGRDMVESEKAAQILEEAGYDMLNCDNGTYDAWYWSHPPGYMPTNCNLADVEHIKQFVKIPVVAAGRMDPETASKSIAAGKLDAMGVARQFLVDPEWVTKLMEGREEDIHPCICCHNACFTMAHYKGVANDQPLNDALHMARCALNPMTMQSKKYKIVPAKKSKNVAIIGAGVGGMEAALVAAKRGHNVTIYEKSSRLGGVFNEASNFSFKEKDRELLAWYERQLKSFSNIKVNFNTEVNDISALKSDAVIVATGATSRKLPIKNFNKTLSAIDYLKDKKQDVGDKPIIIGGGLTGCEIAYEMSLEGKHPIIVEMKQDLIAQRGVCLANSSYLRDYFELHKTEIHLNTKLLEILDDGVKVEDGDHNIIEIKGDKIIMSIGYVPQPLAANRSNVYFVGDCVKVGNLRTVIWRAWDVAMKI